MKTIFVFLCLVSVLAVSLAKKDAKALHSATMDFKCAVCKSGVAELNKHNVGEMLAQASSIESICAALGDSREICTKLMTNYAKPLLGAVKNGKLPTSACYAINWCVADRNYFQVGPHPIPEEKEAQDGVLDLDVQCSVCQAGMTWAYEHVSKTASPADIRSTLNKICPALPLFLRMGCTALIGSKIDAIAKAFASSADAKALCKNVGVCKSVFKRGLFDLESSLADDEDFDNDGIEDEVDLDDDNDGIADDVDTDDDNDGIADDVDTDDDNDGVLDVDEDDDDFDNDGINNDEDTDDDNDGIADDVDTDDDNDGIADDVDNDDDNDGVSDADEEVDEDTDNDGINDDVDTDDDNDGLADDVDTDDNNDGVADPPTLKRSLEGFDASCAVCQTIMIMIQRTLQKNPTPQMVRARLQVICDDGRIPMKDVCQRMVRMSSEVFAGLLIQQVGPQQICQQTSYCATSGKRAVEKVKHEDARVIYKGMSHQSQMVAKYQQPLVNTGQAECQVCQWAISAVEAYISQPGIEQELALVMQELCTVLPGQYATVCQNFVSVYMEEGIDYLIDNLTPPEVCERLTICPLPPTPPTPTP